MEVEVVPNVFFVYLYKELVTFEVAEPADPAIAGLAVIVIV